MKLITRRLVLAGLSSSMLTACVTRGAFVPSVADVRATRRIIMATNGTGLEISGRGNALNWYEVAVTVPENRRVGDVPVSGRDAFGTERVTQLPGLSLTTSAGNHPLVLWVHGYNNTPAEAVYRQVQMAEDIGMEGPLVSFVWPSNASVSGYLHDRDSVLDSRRLLASLITELRNNWKGQLVIVAHSLGSFLVMESLVRLSGQGQSVASMIDGLLLLQPDIDPDVFAEQVRDIGQMPARSVVVLARDDRVLEVSGRLARTNRRVGNSPGSVPPGFQTLDLTGVRDALSPHLVALSSPRILSELSTVYGRLTVEGGGVPTLQG